MNQLKKLLKTILPMKEIFCDKTTEEINIFPNGTTSTINEWGKGLENVCKMEKYEELSDAVINLYQGMVQSDSTQRFCRWAIWSHSKRMRLGILKEYFQK